MASSKPSFPAPSEPNLRRLGVGGGSSERPLKAQLIVFSVIGLLVIAIPLYLLRRPATSEPEAGAKSSKVQDPGLIRSKADAGAPKGKVNLGEIQRVECSASPARKGNEGELCDRLPPVEKALQQAILGNVDCAPKTGKSGTINFVLSVDFSSRRLNVFPGASGEWKGPQAKSTTECVERSLPKIAWEDIPHRYRYYVIAVLASYPAPDPLSNFPQFE